MSEIRWSQLIGGPHDRPHVRSPNEKTTICESFSTLQPSYISTAKIIQYFVGAFMALSVIATIVIMVVMARNGLNISSVPSLVIAEHQCTSLKTHKVIAHLLLNIIGALLLGASNFLQQICTSPTTTEVYRRLPQCDIKFGANMPGELFTRRGWCRKCVWILLILTSVPIHVVLNGIIGYDTVDVSTSYNEVNYSTRSPPAFLRYHLRNAYLTSTNTRTTRLISVI